MSEITDSFKKLANDCYKKNKNGKDCKVKISDKIKLHLECNYCRKVKSPGSIKSKKSKPIKKKRRRKLLHTEIQERLR